MKQPGKPTARVSMLMSLYPCVEILTPKVMVSGIGREELPGSS